MKSISFSDCKYMKVKTVKYLHRVPLTVKPFLIILAETNTQYPTTPRQIYNLVKWVQILPNQEELVVIIIYQTLAPQKT